MDLKPSYEEVVQRLSDLEQETRRLRERERNYRDLFNATNDAIQLTAILEPDVLLNQIVTLLQQRFNLYHVHVYLLDPASGMLIMQAGSGEVGQKLRQQKHRISLEQSRSLVARAARERTIIVVDDVQNEPDFMPNPLLPQTRAEVSVPLLTYDRLIGVLDIQENKVAAFSQADLDTFNTLAGQIAIALHNAALFAEQKRTEAGLRESEERYRIITELMSDYAYAYRVEPDGSFVHEWSTDEPAIRLTGYKPEEVGSSLILYHPDDQERVRQHIQQTIQGNLTSDNYRMITKEGELRWVQIDRRPVWDPQQQRVVRFYGVTQDITERKQAEVEREQLIAELEAKNAELERFTYTVSHDLKAPLVTIKGFLGWLQKDLNNQNMARVQLDIERIQEATEKMHMLLDELLELSRIGRLMNQPENVPFATIVREALALVAGRLAERGVKVEVAEELPLVYGDRARLVEVVQNLVDNAAKFMGNQPRPLIKVGMQKEEGEQVFFVRDNGIGIAPQYHEKVFGLFDKLDPQSEGTGIGLALAKRIVEVHGGRIWVESDGPGRGSTFYFSLQKCRS